MHTLSNVVAVAASADRAVALFESTPTGPSRLVSSRRQPAGTTDLWMLGEPGRPYEIQKSSDLITWDVLATATNRSGSLFLRDASGAPVRFYRSRSL